MNKGYGKINHDFFDALINKDLSKVERRVIDIIIRYSWFCDKGKEKQYARIPNKSIFGKYKIKEVISKLEKANVIILVPSLKLYAINKNVSTWLIPDILNTQELKNEFKDLKIFNLTEQFDELIANNKIIKDKIREIKGSKESEKTEKQKVDKIIMAGIENRNIQIRQSTIALVEEYCEDKDLMTQAIQDVSLNIEAGIVKQNPDKIYVTIKKYYNQLLSRNTPKVKSKVSSGGKPARYDDYVYLLGTKMRGFEVDKPEAIQILLRQNEFTQQDIDKFNKYEKNN